MDLLSLAASSCVGNWVSNKVMGFNRLHVSQISHMNYAVYLLSVGTSTPLVIAVPSGLYILAVFPSKD